MIKILSFLFALFILLAVSAESNQYRFNKSSLTLSTLINDNCDNIKNNIIQFHKYFNNTPLRDNIITINKYCHEILESNNWCKYIQEIDPFKLSRFYDLEWAISYFTNGRISRAMARRLLEINLDSINTYIEFLEKDKEKLNQKELIQSYNSYIEILLISKLFLKNQKLLELGNFKYNVLTKQSTNNDTLIKKQEGVRILNNVCLQIKENRKLILKKMFNKAEIREFSKKFRIPISKIQSGFCSIRNSFICREYKKHLTPIRKKLKKLEF